MATITKSELRGFFYAGIASIALANSFIFSKLSFQEVDFFQFGFWWFIFGTGWNLAYLLIFRIKALALKKLLITINKPLIIIAILEAVASGLFYYAILIMVNPGAIALLLVTKEASPALPFAKMQKAPVLYQFCDDLFSSPPQALLNTHQAFFA